MKVCQLRKRLFEGESFWYDSGDEEPRLRSRFRFRKASLTSTLVYGDDGTSLPGHRVSMVFMHPENVTPWSELQEKANNG